MQLASVRFLCRFACLVIDVRLGMGTRIMDMEVHDHKDSGNSLFNMLPASLDVAVLLACIHQKTKTNKNTEEAFLRYIIIKLKN